jgi:hypothetical protein
LGFLSVVHRNRSRRRTPKGPQKCTSAPDSCAQHCSLQLRRGELGFTPLLHFALHDSLRNPRFEHPLVPTIVIYFAVQALKVFQRGVPRTDFRGAPRQTDHALPFAAAAPRCRHRTNNLQQIHPTNDSWRQSPKLYDRVWPTSWKPRRSTNWAATAAKLVWLSFKKAVPA